MTKIEQARKEAQEASRVLYSKMGKLGALTLAASMTPEQRVSRAKTAANARWENKRKREDAK